VSKFFQALEHAERERARTEPVAPAAPAERAVAAERAVEAAPAASVRPVAEAEPPVASERAPGYGAPLARDAGTAHAGAFSTLLEPEQLVEPGEVDDHLVSVLEPTSVAAEQYRGVRLAVENFRRERGARLFAVASPARGDGKTTTTINLAGALAQAPDARVVVVEADLRHPAMAGMLGLRGGYGLSAYLLDPSIEVEQVIEWPRGLGFAVVVAGSASSMPYELLASARLSTLLATLRETFDFVLVDTPPTLPFPDVGILRELVDGFVLVVRANRTPREQVRACVDAIGPQRVLGMIFNDDDRTSAVASRELPRRRLRDYLDPVRGGARGA
jgi:capsular exopolysaccharide synthesis family protein